MQQHPMMCARVGPHPDDLVVSSAAWAGEVLGGVIHFCSMRRTVGLDDMFPVCSYWVMEDLGFKIVKTNGGDELLARIGNYEICKAAFEKALFLYPNEHLEMRQGARVILKSRERL